VQLQLGQEKNRPKKTQSPRLKKARVIFVFLVALLLPHHDGLYSFSSLYLPSPLDMILMAHRFSKSLLMLCSSALPVPLDLFYPLALPSLPTHSPLLIPPAHSLLTPLCSFPPAQSLLTPPCSFPLLTPAHSPLLTLPLTPAHSPPAHPGVAHSPPFARAPLITPSHFTLCRDWQKHFC
jgi:hypothetical protein